MSNQQTYTPTPAETKFSESLVAELKSMLELGMHVPQKALKMAADVQEVSQYTNMGVTDAASLLIELC